MAVSTLRSLVVGLATATIALQLGAPEPISLLVAVTIGLACWRSPPWRTPTHPKPYVCPEPNLDLGAVVRAPVQPLPVWPGQRFRLALSELARHVTVVGVTGSGKTTTLARLIDAALAARWPVLVVDAKGGRLADVIRTVGERHGLAARIWLPGHAESWTYDICVGDPTSVSNRLVGAFEYGFDAQVYRNLAQSIVPLVIEAMLAAGIHCDLDSLRFSLDRAHLTGLIRRLPDSPLKVELMTLREDELHRSTFSGLVGRLRALRFGLFGPWLLPSDRTVDLTRSLVEPGVTYMGLPATAASEDVELVGRVLVQHLKQVAYTALWSADRQPALIVFDEFVSLHEAAQLVDLLLQAREAHLAVVVSTQQVPMKHPLKHSVLGAGSLIVHQVGGPDDADMLARALGTRTAPELVRQVVLARDGSLARRLLRTRQSFLIPPDELARLPVGQAAIAVRFGDQRIGLVQVDPLLVT